jgi:hypothetical protein
MQSNSNQIELELESEMSTMPQLEGHVVWLSISISGEMRMKTWTFSSPINYEETNSWSLVNMV